MPSMTKRQLAGFAVTCGIMLVLWLGFLLAPAFGYTSRNWLFAVGSIVVFSWGGYYRSGFARKG